MAGRAGHNHRRWRLSGHKKALDAVRNDINVTPLVDVMLVLLIIFMLMTLIMGRGQEVKLPTATNFSAEKDKSQPVVSITCDNEAGGCEKVGLYVEKRRINDKDAPIGPKDLKEMQQQVSDAWAAPKNPEGVGRIYLKADSRIAYKNVLPVIEYMNKTMGMSNVDLAISQPATKE